MTDVKICGLTRTKDVAAACELGASLLGFNFVASSPRRLTVGLARQLAQAAAPGVGRVGVFFHAGRSEIRRAIAEVPLEYVQLHRPVTAEDVDSLAVPIFAVVRVEDGLEAVPADDILSRCGGLLWDSSAGKGRRPDWSRVPPARGVPVAVFVAGGLDAETVGGVIRRLHPSGVDVASGVESAPGIKDLEKLSRFFVAVREADLEAR
jgi:phosphoribosylanthranilate isomerase